jgi:macrolide transport system ATP-binding/permease protein
LNYTHSAPRGNTEIFRSIGAAIFEQAETPGDFEGEKLTKIGIVNRTFERLYFPGQNALGKQIAFDSKQLLTIIGEIEDIQEGQLDAAPRGAAYLPFYQSPSGCFVLLARTAQDERNLLPALVSTLASIDGGMALYEPMTMDQKIHNAPATYLHWSSAWLVGGFAFVALLLGVVGLYGIVAPQ